MTNLCQQREEHSSMGFGHSGMIYSGDTAPDLGRITWYAPGQSIVAVPIPLPKGFVVADNYKIQFTYDGDRLVTPWLKIIGKGAPNPPMLHIHLKRSSDSLTSVSAKVLPVPQGYLYAHHHLLNEFQNATVWPKHLLVEYSWSTPQSVDALSALYFIFFVCLVAFMGMALSVLVAYETKLKAFMAEIAGEDPLSVAPLVKGD
ncbi:hypothetical protein WJX75_002113 [Coccomyxa subellipsoidea]|uniref:Uncharacterized protein n=1 Tax=Coccomyxa subellipsoidea TaxID=248742 RepID=A0ABR2YHP6_9CHLO